jgi:hypothetical protein
MLNLEFEYEWINSTTINLTSSNYEGTQGSALYTDIT